MNRRSFLKAATGCAVAAARADTTTDIAAGGYQSCVLWAVDLTTGKWREVDYETFMGCKP